MKKTIDQIQGMQDKLAVLQSASNCAIETYKSKKILQGIPCLRGSYNEFQGWKIPVGENPDDEGMLTVYNNGTEDMHISWCPLDIFHEGNDLLKINSPLETELSWGCALLALKAGKKVARAGWDGLGMFVFLVQGSKFTVNRPPLLGIYPEGTEITYNPHMDMKTADGSVATWNPSGMDNLAEDWFIVGEDNNA